MLHQIQRGLAAAAFGLIAAGLCMTWGCQVVNTGHEVRSDEQMLPVTFENARAQELFVKIADDTYGDPIKGKSTRIGTKSLSLYSNSESLGWNANCNEHIRKMDTNADMVISEREAESYYKSLEAGKN